MSVNSLFGQSWEHWVLWRKGKRIAYTDPQVCHCYLHLSWVHSRRVGRCQCATSSHICPAPGMSRRYPATGLGQSFRIWLPGRKEKVMWLSEKINGYILHWSRRANLVLWTVCTEQHNRCPRHTSYSLFVQHVIRKDSSSSHRLRLFFMCIHTVRSWETQ